MFVRASSRALPPDLAAPLALSHLVTTRKIGGDRAQGVASGKRIEKVLPTSGVEHTESMPPCAATISRAVMRGFPAIRRLTLRR